MSRPLSEILNAVDAEIAAEASAASVLDEPVVVEYLARGETSPDGKYVETEGRTAQLADFLRPVEDRAIGRLRASPTEANLEAVRRVQMARAFGEPIQPPRRRHNTEDGSMNESTRSALGRAIDAVGEGEDQAKGIGILAAAKRAFGPPPRERVSVFLDDYPEGSPFGHQPDGSYVTERVEIKAGISVHTSGRIFVQLESGDGEPSFFLNDPESCDRMIDFLTRLRSAFCPE